MFLKNISYYIQYCIALLIMPLIVIFIKIKEIDWKYEFKYGYTQLFKNKDKFEAYKKKIKDDI